MSNCSSEVNESVAARLRRGPVPAPSADRKAEGRAERGAKPDVLANRSFSSPTDSSSLSTDQKSNDSSPYAYAAQDTENRLNARAKSHYLRTDMRDMVFDIHKPLSLCGLGCKPAAGGQRGEISLKVQAGAARLSGTTRCSSPWACPVCAPGLADQRAIALQPQVEAHVAAGYTAWLITLTIRHTRIDDVAELFRLQTAAWAKVTSGKVWQNWRTKGDIQFVRGFDCTWSAKNGWHPHLHLMVLIGPGHADPEALAHAIVERWGKCCTAVGLDSLDRVQDVERVDDPARAARYAVSPAAVYEAHAMAKKRQRGKGDGLTPMEILERSIEERLQRADIAAERGVPIFEIPMGQYEILWRAYVHATKGLHQCSTSRKLDLNPDREIEDPDAIDEAKPQDTLLEPEGGLKLAILGLETMRVLDRKKAVPTLLQMAEFRIEHMQKLREIEVFLSRFISPLDSKCDWKVVWPPTSKEAAAQARTFEERISERDNEIATHRERDDPIFAEWERLRKQNAYPGGGKD